MIITQEWLAKHEACAEVTHWFLSQKETELSKVVKALIKDGKYGWANWTLSKVFTKKQSVQYAIYSAKQSLHLFEKVYPNDKRPRLAIKAAAEWVKNPSDVTKDAALSAASAAALSAESAASWYAGSAASAAWSAESAAWSAAESAAWSAAWAAAESAESAEVAMVAAWKKILKYGLKLVTK